MIQKRTPIKPLFFIQCGDWETVRSAISPLRACIDALAEAKKRYGDALKLSSVVIAMDLHKQLEDQDDPITAFSLNGIKQSLRR